MVGNFHRMSAYDCGFWRYFIFNLLKRYPTPVDFLTQSNSIVKVWKNVFVIKVIVV